jgi:hypothetical protein
MDTNWHPTAAEIIVTLVLVILPWSFPSMGIAWRCVFWFFGWILVVHLMFLLIPMLGNLPLFMKICLSVGTTFLLAAGLYFPIRSEWRAEKAAATSGFLSVVVNDGLDHSDDPPRIQFGESDGGIILPTETQPGIALPADLLTLKRVNDKRVNDKLLLSTTVRDRAGNLVVEIVDNRWTVSPSKTNCWDKNYTDDSLEVKDGRGRVVLQVRLLPDRVQLQGEWPNETGKNLITEQGQYDERTGIAPRFKYPSEDYWGQRIK